MQYSLRAAAIPALALFVIPVWASDSQASGVPNFHQVNQHVYRGGQPTDAGFNSLAKLGVKVVIDLREADEHRNAEAAAVQALGMRYINVPMRGTVAPKDEEVSKALALLNASDDAPVFVHCRRGSDRTGTVIACYRISHDRWDNQKAFKEARSFGMYITELGMKHFILNFHADADPQPIAPLPALIAPSN